MLYTKALGISRGYGICYRVKCPAVTWHNSINSLPGFTNHIVVCTIAKVEKIRNALMKWILDVDQKCNVRILFYLNRKGLSVVFYLRKNDMPYLYFCAIHEKSVEIYNAFVCVSESFSKTHWLYVCYCTLICVFMENFCL